MIAESDRRYPNRPLVGVGAIIFKRDRILMAQRGKEPLKGWWSLPGGALETGESLADAVRREVREETGLDVEPIALTGVYKNMNQGIVALVFRCKITGGDLTPTDEATAFRWATDTEITGLMDQAYAVRVLDALNGDHPPAVRHHDGVHLL